MKDSKFVWLQLQRARTEGRIGILENVSLGRPLRPKGFAHREMALAWVVLTHNLWMLTRLRKSKDQADPLRQAE